MRNVYRAVVRDTVKRLTEELVEMYGDENPEKEEKIREFLQSKESHLVKEVYKIDSLFEQVEVATNDVAWPYLSEFLEGIE